MRVVGVVDTCENHQKLAFPIVPWGTRPHKEEIQQDKVNYAVSDREDRVTGATILTRMAGCNGMYWAATVLR